MRAPAMFYELYGRIIDSDTPLAGLDVCPARKADVRIRHMPARGHANEDGRLIFESEQSHEDGSVVARLSQTDSSYWWSFGDIVSFRVSRDGSLIEWFQEGGEARDLATLLAGSVAGFALQLRGLVGLHGNGLTRDGAAFGLLGPSGYGKSSLSAALMNTGCEFLTDDLLAVEMDSGIPMALSGQQRLKLWPDALEKLLPNDRGTQTYVSWLLKQCIAPSALGARGSEARPLKALFILIPIAAEETPMVQPVHGERALIALVANSYQAHLLIGEPELVAQRLDFLQALVRETPVFALGCPRSFERLPMTAELVISQLRLEQRVVASR